MSEQLKAMKETLMATAQSQMANLDCVDAKELGEVIDMIKDIEEAEYYCAVTKAMEERKAEIDDQDKINAAVMAARVNNSPQNYYTPYIRYGNPRLDYDYGRMYYDGGNGSGMSGTGMNGGSSSGRNGYREYPSMVRDYREGRSPIIRRGYMESKENHMDKSYQIQELEKYVQELGQDITEMINDASPEEKDLLRDKLNMLAQKLV